MSLNKKITNCFTKEKYKKRTDGAGLRGASIEKFEHYKTLCLTSVCLSVILIPLGSISLRSWTDDP